MRSIGTLVFLALLSLSAAASPVITSVTPSSGPPAGGTTVVIRGTGFSNNCVICSPPIGEPTVYFGGAEATEVTFVDSTTLHAVTPPHLPGTVDVMVTQLDASDPNWHVFPNGFTYFGEGTDVFEPVLFPIFMRPIGGQGGSEFRTTAKFWNKSHNQPVTFYGLDTSCTLIDPPIYPDSPFQLAPRQNHSLDLFPSCTDSVGKLFYVSKGEKNLAATSRVWETSKQAENHGVEIPVVRLDDFTEEPIALLDVPTDPKFRLTLRIYGLNRGESLVNLWYGSGIGNCCGDTWNSMQLPITPGRNMFEPSYAVVTDFRPADGFPPFPEKINVLVSSNGPDGAVIWAFITVTNNETQHITTITPQQ